MCKDERSAKKARFFGSVFYLRGHTVPAHSNLMMSNRK
nr:MAG TPA: hypothetical protein [Caudoviricetes sp.]